jgi:NAD(P)-dependent dehydrogenase (short-subunit alcohol dehydrogenase family)
MAMDLKDKGVVVMLLHPGFVRTNILPKESMPPEAVEADEAARKLWHNIVSKKGMEDTGKFWHREGFELPW